MLLVAEYDLESFLEDKCIEAQFPRDMLKMLDRWFGCLISALAYAHQARVKHEDIKPSNILIKGKSVYLTDFGSATDFSHLLVASGSDFMVQGTPVYWAPEPLPHGRPADVFSFGCVFAEMLTVRQRRTMREFREYRFSNQVDLPYAYRSNLPKVRRWLKTELSIDSKNPVAQTILEQILNMLGEEPNYRVEARRVWKILRVEEDDFFLRPLCLGSNSFANVRERRELATTTSKSIKSDPTFVFRAPCY